MANTRLEQACARFDALNAADPTTELEGGVERPRLLVQAERLARWVERLEPEASEALRLAAHCQHLERWKSPRSDFPEGRVGYLTWRTQLGRFHAARAREELVAIGYDDATISAVERILTKQNLRSSRDSQTMEDALCLVFLEYELDEFIEKYPDEEKALEILRKSWRKMSPRGHEAALALPLGERALELVGRALGG